MKCFFRTLDIFSDKILLDPLANKEKRSKVVPIFPAWNLGIFLDYLSPTHCESLEEKEFKTVYVIIILFLAALASSWRFSDILAVFEDFTNINTLKELVIIGSKEFTL